MGSGTKIKVGILRDGKERDLNVVLQQMADQSVKAKLIHPRLEGATLSTAPDDAAIEGVLIEALEKNSPAARMGLEKSDIIIGLNKQRVKSLPELRKLLEDEPSVLALNIYRDGAQLYIVVR
jgi:S1-C subfamily serine protease